METLKNKGKDNIIDNKENVLNGGILNNNKKIIDFNFNSLNKIETENNDILNIMPKTKRKINEYKIDKRITMNSSFLAFRKYSNGNMKTENKNCENSATLNENNINIGSIGNVSYMNLIDKNENCCRNIIRKENLKVKDNDNKNETINKINTIYENQLNLIFKKNRSNKEVYQNKNLNNNIIINNDDKTNKTNKIQRNNYINKSRTFNDLDNSQMFQKNSSKLLQRFCFICEVFEEKLYHAKNCNHLFCKECGKYYYEQQIDKGIYNLKCPRYSCYNYLNLKDIKEILPSESYIKIETHIKINKTRINKKQSIEKKLEDINIDINSNKRNSTTIDINNNNESYKGIKIIKKNLLKIHIPKSTNKNSHIMNFVFKQHMIKISDSTRFKTKVKNEREIKKLVCSKCGKTTLFSRDDQNFIRCLNCLNAICKYCYKQLDNSNTLRRLNSICGVCYSRIRLHKKSSKFKKYLYEILFVVSGFIAVWYGFSTYEAEYLVKNKKGKKYYLFLFVLIIFLVFNSITLILFIPYFPIFISLFEI